MTKHAVLTRTTMIVALFVSLFALGSCTKHVTQVVDQGFSAIYTIKSTDWTADTYTGTGAYTGLPPGPMMAPTPRQSTILCIAAS